MKSYHAFLLRCWCETTDTDGQPSWRFLVAQIGVAPQAPRGFAGFEELTAFLSAELGCLATDPVPRGTQEKEQADQPPIA